MNFASKIPVLRSFARAYALTKFKKEWRKRNKQNQTVPMNTFPMECVEVGNGTYGELHILSYFPPIEKLTIGNYVSLASNVHFILSGNHQTETLFTYPIRSTLEGKHCQTDSRSKGPIIVEDEVWIGYGATILSGVTIGKGSIIAAGAIVASDIPPYAIRWNLAFMRSHKEKSFLNTSNSLIKTLASNPHWRNRAKSSILEVCPTK